MTLSGTAEDLFLKTGIMQLGAPLMITNNNIHENSNGVHLLIFITYTR